MKGNKMRKLEAIITYKYRIEVDNNDDIVKEYVDDNELVNDCAKYKFQKKLPVMAVGAVRIISVELVNVVSCIEKI